MDHRWEREARPSRHRPPIVAAVGALMVAMVIYYNNLLVEHPAEFFALVVGGVLIGLDFGFRMGP